ncbi:MAG: ABC transporter ATP-binding protein [Armatimonadetes bacterium]|nr:ABC transporter ATP-binding protein [Armatimonadota bacterium]
MSESVPDPILKIDRISKRYGSVQALNNVFTEFFSGEIHAVLGENGAGKSTLVSALAGFVIPDSGEVVFHGQPAPMGHPQRLRELGIAMVHQHFMLVPNFTVEENLALDQIRSLNSPLKLDDLTSRAMELARQLGWEINPKVRTGSLPVGIQQRIEILKALVGDSQVIILDEPTAVLTPEEIDDLFSVLRDLKSQGKAIILIAHKLSEVMSIADVVTVLRKGELIARARIAETNPTQLAEWMVGDLPPSRSESESQVGEVVLSLNEINVKGDRGEVAINGLSLEARAGEVLGIGGVDGNGQLELAEAIVCIRKLDTGSRTSPEKIGYIPQDRQRDGLALSMSIEDNLLAGALEDSNLSKRGLLKSKKIKTWAQKQVENFSIKIGTLSDPVKSLSGGNQQKVIVSRVLSQRPQLIVAVNPTRGLDIKATDFVRTQLAQAAEKGAAVVLISTDLDELAELSTRTVYLNRGQLAESLVGAVSQ